MVDVYDLKSYNYWHCNTAIADLNFQIFCRKQTVTQSGGVKKYGHGLWGTEFER